MVVVALETVTRAGSLALWHDGVIEAIAGDPSRTHAERLPADLVDLVARHGRTIGDVDVFAVVSGPGSFTGLRVGLAAVQGLSLAASRRVIGIPTLDALTAAWALDRPGRHRVMACLDGMRSQVFFSAVETDMGGHTLDDATRLIDASVGTPAEAIATVRALGGDPDWVIVGDGAARYAADFAAGLPDALVTDPPRLLADAAVVLAARHPDRAGAPHALRPIYVRRPDAELARARAGRSTDTFRAEQCAVRRAASPEDFAAVHDLQQQSFTNPWSADAIRWELENTDVARLYVLAAPDARLLGYCACWMVFDELHINSFAVDPAWRRKGLARHLLRHVMAEGLTAGARAVTLEVRASNVAARQLYEGLGFRVEGVRRDYYQEPREDALILWHRSA